MRSAIVLSLMLLPIAAAGEGHFAIARVIDAVPVTVSERVPQTVRRCTRTADTTPAGDVRHNDPAALPGELIAADSQRRATRCRTETVYRSQEKIVAWRVRYAYGGEIYERRMSQRPGERIRVRVDLTAR